MLKKHLRQIFSYKDQRCVIVLFSNVVLSASPNLRICFGKSLVHYRSSKHRSCLFTTVSLMPNNLQKILNDFLNFSMFLFTGFDFQIFLELTSLCYNPSLSSSHLQQARSNGTKSSQPPTYGN